MKNSPLLKAAALVTGIFFLSGLLFSTQLPKLRAWVLVKIEETSQKQLPVRILPRSVEVSLFPIGVRFKALQILPKPEIKDHFQSARIEDITISVSHWQLFNGRLRITDLIVNGAEIQANIPKPKKTQGPILEGLFATIGKIPVEDIDLNDVSVKLGIPHLEMAMDIRDFSAHAEKRRGGSFALSVKSGSLQITGPNIENGLRLEAEGELIASRKSVELSSLKLRRGNSFLSFEGSFLGNTEALDFSDINARMEAGLLLESLHKLIKRALPETAASIPHLQGRAEMTGKVTRVRSDSPEAEFELNTSDLAIGGFVIGKLSSKGTYRKKIFSLPKSTVANTAGLLELNEFTADPATRKISGTLKTANLNLHALMSNLGLKNVPVFLTVKGELPCLGNFSDKPTFSCRGSLQGENLFVRESMSAQKNIVTIPQFKADGEVSVDNEKVTYAADLKMPNSKGSSQGVISYLEGFKISYEADQLNFLDASDVVGLKLEGKARVQGKTEGNSQTATVAMDVDGKDIWLENFWLGNAKSKLQYKAGEVSFTGIQGYYSVSRYTGDVRLNALDSTIAISGRVPFFDSRDLLKIFSRKMELPVEITGTGQAQINVQGPLQLNRLSYDLKSSLYRGSVAGETFDEVQFNVVSKQGEVRTERAELRKGASTVTLTGTGKPDGVINALVSGKNLNLEESTLVASTGLSLSGLVDIEMKLKGPILDPDTELKGRLHQTALGDQGMPDSNFKLRFASTTIEGEGSLIGDVVKASFVMPLNASAPFYLKVRTQDWNFTPLFAAISGPGSRKEYEGRLTSEIELNSPQGGFWNSSGSAKINRFLLSRGSLGLESRGPMQIDLQNGQVSLQNFVLEGDNIFLKITESPNPISKLDLQVNGKLDMTLLALITPFFEDLRGMASFAFNLKSGAPGSTSILGSAYVERGYLKFFDFPHPIENAKMDLVFNQRQILVNTLKAEIGAGRVLGSGGIELKGSKNYPVSLTGTFEKVNLEVPPKVKTTGSGTISLSGNWFPYLLKADYKTQDGLITMEFGGDSGPEKTGIRRNYFLPELLVRDSFTPIVLDLNIDFSRGLEIKNEQLEGKIAGNLTVAGSPGKPEILGSITSDKNTKIFFRDTAFEVTNSNVQFTNPKELNPKLYVSAISRVQEYDIMLLIQGTGNRPEINLTSVPPLAERDIISLLALGATDSQLATNINSQEQASSTGLQIGTGMIKNNPLSKEIKNRLGVDVQFSAGFDDTAATQKIIVSKQFNRKLDVTGSRSLGKTQNTEAKVRYRLSDKVSLIGSWQGREYEDTKQNEELSKDTIGLDVEYKFEFK